MSDSWDTLIRGGMLVDGTGAPARRADLALAGGRIAAMGEDLDGTAARVIDADGRVVAPGFVDIHTHYDAQVLWDRMLSISPWHGVTTVVAGNCGFGIAPTRPEHRDLILRTLENVEGMSLAALQTGLGEDWPFETFGEFLDTIERVGTAINFGALVGHTPVRTYVMGEEATEREASDDEVAAMRGLVADALTAGAVGFATSKAPTHVGYDGRPVPSRAASLAEINALASTLADAGRGLMQATIGSGFLFDQFGEIARATGRPVSWTALLAGAFGPDGHRMALERSAAQQAEGLGVYPQVSCRPLLFEFRWSAPFPFEALDFFRPVSQADREGKKRVYADEDFRARFRAWQAPSTFGVRWSQAEFSYVPNEPALEGRNLKQVADERGVHPVDLALDVGLATNLEARIRAAVANTDEDALAEMLPHPAAMLGLSDAGAHASQLCDAGFSTHLLGHWVREKGVLSLEQAVRLLSSRSADIFGIRDRGRLQAGLAADVVIFEPDSVACGPLRRVYDLPGGADRLVTDAEGIDAVIVNGTLIREHGKDCVDAEGPLPGRVLRGGSAR